MSEHFFGPELKPAKREVFCALCRSPREIKTSPDLTMLNYLQIFFIAGLFTALTYSWINIKGILIAIPLWAGFEFVKKSLYRKELSCPKCGFDPTWYKRDVKMARAKVQSFFEGQKQTSSSNDVVADRIN